MECRAGPLLANRSLSALIVLSFVMSAFAGLYVFANPSPSSAQPIGDLTISTGTYTIENIDQPVDGDVEVYGDGELIIRDGSLKVISNEGTPRSVSVHSGGTITLEHGVLTTYLDQIWSWPYLTLDIDDGTVVATAGSALRFPGSITVQGNGELILYDSSIDRLPPEDLVYVSSTIMDTADDGPVMSFDDGTLKMFDSSINALPEYGGMPASNLTLEGESTLLAVNSFISVDFGPIYDEADWFTHNMLVLNDSSTAQLYGTHFEPYPSSAGYAGRHPAISALGESYFALPTSLGPEDTTGQVYTDLVASGDGQVFHVGPGEVMAVDTFSAGGPATVDGAILNIRYLVDPGYNGANSFTWKREGGGSAASTGITPLSTETSYVERSFDLHAAGVVTTADLGDLDINFGHSGTTGDVQVDSMSIMITIGPEAYVYRWVDIVVGDEYGVPIPDSDITAIFTGSTSYEGQPSFYFGGDDAGAVPPNDVLDYMGVSAEDFGVTGPLGAATIPLLTDVICGGEYPNSLFVGNFEITGTTIQDSVPYFSTETFSFPAYPAMTVDDQHFELTVDVEDVSAESPDPARWLVVPPDLTIENMTYYHAGDVIVAADGDLVVRNSVFQLVQEEANERAVYVDGTETSSGHLVIEDSSVVSTYDIDIIVKGYGILEISGSDLHGVNIYAMEYATVILDECSMDGTITTSWNSRATIVVQDTTLTESPVLSGMAVGAFTNVSIPSIVVEDDARAMIYRWIHVTVYDGAGNRLQGAVVSARYFANDTHLSTTVTDVMGVARLNSLGTILTASGSTFVGNYKINATYWSLGDPYDSDEISVGVMPYTEPLTANATYAVLWISDLYLADIQVVAMWTEPTAVVYNSTCSIKIQLANIGDKDAADIPVDVYVGAELIDSLEVPVLQIDENVYLSVDWTPDALGPHTITVEVNEPPVFDEGSFTNNVMALPVTVLDYADLEFGEVSVYVGSTEETEVAGGQSVVIRATLYNTGEAPVTDITVELTADYGDGALYSKPETIFGTISGGGSRLVEISYTIKEVTHDTDLELILDANPTRVIPEATYDNNVASTTVLVLDVRGDLSVTAAGIDILYDLEYVPEFGRTITIAAEISNDGGTDLGPYTVLFGIRQDAINHTIAVVDTLSGILPGAFEVVSAEFRINLTVGGTYEVYVFADPYGNHTERNETNNFAVHPFDIVALDVDISVIPTSTSYEAGQTIVVDVLVYYAGSVEPIAGLEGVTVELMDEDGDLVPGTDSLPATTSSAGKATFQVNIPEALETGTYTIVASLANVAETGEYSLEISGTVSARGIPLLIWLIVIAVIVAVVVGFTIYTYVYGLGKLVECGECGAFVPAASKRCPKCGVEFEVGTMKCSECGAWVPAESPECPNCGVKFVGEELGDEDYLETMRNEYDEMVSKYRELAKSQLGKKFSDKRFEEWWRAQPMYISFDDWLAKEEEKRKEGPIACPVCGTLNPKEATVCHKCGTVFGVPGVATPGARPPSPPAAGMMAEEPEEMAEGPYREEPPSQQPPAAPKMVIRRPIDRKVVPKKIIKTPVKPGEESGEGDNSQ